MVSKGHLKDEEREKIYLYLNKGLSMRSIGRKIGRDHTVVVRELTRNKDPNGDYGPFKAHKIAMQRRSEANKNNPLKNPRILKYVKDKLQETWSPEQIAGRIKIDIPNFSISPEAIYQYIYKSENKKLELWVYLRRKRPKRTSKYKRGVKREIIPNRVFIDERPEHINNREYIGHWESDLMEGKKTTKDVVSVTVERKSRFLIIGKMPNKTSGEKVKTLVSKMEKLPPWLRRSITFDNGTENYRHEEIGEKLNSGTYFCHAYRFWEKGTNENSIGLVREFFPKRSSLANVTQRDVNLVAELINSRPRKILGYKTPYEVFYKELNGAF